MDWHGLSVDCHGLAVDWAYHTRKGPTDIQNQSLHVDDFLTLIQKYAALSSRTLLEKSWRLGNLSSGRRNSSNSSLLPSWCTSIILWIFASKRVKDRFWMSSGPLRAWYAQFTVSLCKSMGSLCKSMVSPYHSSCHTQACLDNHYHRLFHSLICFLVRLLHCLPI